MPCMSYDDDWKSYSPSVGTNMLKAQADMLARIACRALEALESGSGAEAVLADKEIKAWWSKHKKADRAAQAQRDREAKKQAELEALRQSGMAKLTQEELEVFKLVKKPGKSTRRSPT